MKNIMILKTAIFAILIMFGFTGCTALKYTMQTLNPKIGTTEVDGINIPREAVIEANKNTKVYYEDVNSKIIRNDLSQLSSFLNQNYSNFKVKLDEKINYIISNKTFSSIDEVNKDFENIKEFISTTLEKNPELKEKFGMGSNIYINQDLAKNNKLGFTIYKEEARNIFKDKVKRQVEAGGWIMVNNPNEADKIIQFSLSREYLGNEIYQIKKEEKGMQLDYFSSETNSKKNIVLPYESIQFINYYSKKETIEKSPTNVGTPSATKGGVGVAAGVTALGILGGGEHFHTISNQQYFLPIMLVIDKKSNNSVIKFFKIGVNPESEEAKARLNSEISAYVNQYTDSTSRDIKIK